MRSKFILKNYSFSLFSLNFVFIISLFSILFSIIFSEITGINFQFYYLTYFFSVVTFIFSFLYFFKKLLKINKHIFYLLFYFICVTIPITIFLGNFVTVLIFIKNWLLFIPIFFFMVINFKNVNDFLPFLKTVVFGGIAASLYVCFEMINKVFNIFPSFNESISNYILNSKQKHFFEFANPEKFDVFNMIRPIGLDINLVSGGFFIASVFLILLFSGYRFFSSKKINLLMIFISYFGLICTTSRQNIFSIHLILLLVLFLVFFKRKYFNKEVYKTIKIFLFSIFSILFLIIFSIFSSEIGTLLINFYSGNTGGSGTASIIFSDMLIFFDNMIDWFGTYPFNFFLGIGTYTPEYPGIYYYLPPPMEIHFLYDILYTFGLFGFIIFWQIFIYSLYRSWKMILKQRKHNNNFADLYMSVFFINILFMLSNIHYSPIGLSTSFIIAFIPLFMVFSKKINQFQS